mgnify:CR=1 FL=1
MQNRTHTCDELRLSDAGKRVQLSGWMDSVRIVSANLAFVILRDFYGTTQVVIDDEEQMKIIRSLNKESVISVTGIVRERDNKNPKIPTGDIEVEPEKIDVLGRCRYNELPFQINRSREADESIRLKYRYLDLRNPAVKKNIILRCNVIAALRQAMMAHDFLEITTPILTASSPEGARDYLVPARKHPGKFYALPQSPQIFKQMLMVGGMDKYYQVARCFRDEDLRADRQPEFTQVDMEMSFVEQEDILQHLERLFKSIFRDVMGREIGYDFPRLTWQKSMDRYGCDKPDLRFGMEIRDVTDLAAECSFSVFRRVADEGGKVRALNCKGCAEKFTRTTIETLTDHALGYGAKGMAWILIHDSGEVNSILQKYFTKAQWQTLLTALDAQNGDFILFCADKFQTVCRTLCGLRLEVGDMLGLRDKQDYRFCFVTDFPEFEWSDEEQRYMAMHHPFTMPYEEDLPYLMTDPARVRSQAYDVVLNGIELGSGSIRIHRPEVQALMFRALGFTEETARARFGFMIDAFKYGTPPHGGFAFGLDRLVMQLLGADSLRDVIAFPKVRDASDLMTSAPDFVDAEQLEVLQLGVSTAAEAEKHPQKKRPTMAIKTVAELAKLSLTAEEEVTMGEELNTILGFAEALQEVDTTDVPQTAHVIPTENVLREDIPAAPFDRDLLLSNAPTHTEDCVNVPQTFD